MSGFGLLNPGGADQSRLTFHYRPMALKQKVSTAPGTTPLPGAEALGARHRDPSLLAILLQAYSKSVLALKFAKANIRSRDTLLES